MWKLFFLTHSFSGLPDSRVDFSRCIVRAGAGNSEEHRARATARCNKDELLDSRNWKNFLIIRFFLPRSFGEEECLLRRLLILYSTFNLREWMLQGGMSRNFK